MTRRSYLLVVALMLASGLVGGIAARTIPVTRTIVAEEFRLVDGEGKLRGRLYVDAEGRGQVELLPGARRLK